MKHPIAALATLAIEKPRTILLIAAAVAAPMAYAAFLLFSDVRADVRELLPREARSVEVLAALEKRFGGFSQLSIVIESPSRDANRKFSADLSRALADGNGEYSVRNGFVAESAFLKAHQALYVSLEDLEALRDALEDVRRRANPLLVDLDDENEATPPELELEKLREKYLERAGTLSRFKDGYFESPDGSTAAVLVRVRGQGFAVERNRRLVSSVRSTIASLGPANYHPQLEVGLTGDVANLVAEQSSLIEDITLSSIIVAVLLAAAVIGYYRNARSIYLLAVPVLFGLAVTFGLSYFIIGYLNASSAFLGPIIAGNGINFGVILLARFEEERENGTALDRALTAAMLDTLRGTSTAACAASIAYGSLIATHFLGFRHFGIIGGLGMIVCWMATFLLLPPLIVVSRARIGARRSHPITTLLFSLIARHARAASIAGVLLGIAGAVATTIYLRDPLEKNFQVLRSTLADAKGPAYWEKRIRRVFPESIQPQVVLTDRPEDVGPTAMVLRTLISEQGAQSPLGGVTALTDFIPDQQSEKLVVLSEIRRLMSDEVIETLPEKDRRLAREYRPPEGLTAVTRESLPESIRADFRELDGREGLAILVIPNNKLNLYHADEIKRVAAVLREIVLPNGRVVESSGNFVIYADMLDAVAEDGPKATLYSLLGVIILCLVAFRSAKQAGVVIGALLLGVVGLGAMLLIADQRINFLNFIALPITFGIGVDYAVNIYSRYLVEREKHGPFDAAKIATVQTGGAVALCSLTTIIGYASLLVAHNGALISFGRVAILGEVTTLVAAMIILPAGILTLKTLRVSAE